MDKVKPCAACPGSLTDMFPEVHKRMMPYIGEAVELYGGGASLTEDSLDKMTQYVVSKSFGAEPPPQWHSERSLADVARGLILTELISNYGYNGYPYDYGGDGYSFFPAYPFFSGEGSLRGRGRFRHEFFDYRRGGRRR